MRELLLPWDAQPQEAADVDLSTGFARRLTCLWTGAGYWYGPAEGTYSRRIGSADDVAAYGRGRTTFNAYTGTSDSGRLPDGSFGTASAGTFLAVVRVPTGTANANLKGGNTGDMQIRVTSGANLVFVKRGVSVRITASGVVAQDGVYVVAGSYGAENRLYCNGVLVGVDSGNLVTTQGTGAYVGHDGGGAEDWSGGGIGLIAAWDRQLSTDEVRELSADPWQLFEPRRIFVPVAVGGGGSWSVSLTETAGATDSLGAATTALVSLIESASAADIIGAATIAAVALTEAASASDTQTASYSSTGSGSVTESASASDTLDAATTMLRALTETASADDQLAAATTMLRAITESASAADTPAASYSGAGAATIEELASATDALTAAATLLVTILEAGNATDALQAATTMVGLITESAAATDSVSAASPTVADVSITELAEAVDAIAAYVAGDLDALARYTITGRARSLALVGRLRKLEVPQ